ncbi:endonuclease domain-containing protein [Aureimonas sp. AU12]|uniref:endonuclease domain-containing protein n=1 Tax=Aureimonas sp. AU12 TaxID=1638161 RepID=UPI0009EBBE9C|nr:DUF559 domain-containing protein [Aureimonas sp. AU12]
MTTSDATRHARQLRLAETDAEARLWSDLRNRRLNGHKFVRQFPIEGFIADFACRPQRLVVELDGGQHGSVPAMRRDAERTRALNAVGFSVLRFWNDDIFRERRAVLDTILAVLGGAIRSPSPGLRFAPATLSPEGRGVGGVIAEAGFDGVVPQTREGFQS